MAWCIICGAAHVSCPGSYGPPRYTPVGLEMAEQTFGPPTYRPASNTEADMSGKYVAEERIYLDKEGNVVGDKDPNKHTLVAAKGAHLPMAQARELGLVKDGAESNEADEAVNKDDEPVGEAPRKAGPNDPDTAFESDHAKDKAKASAGKSDEADEDDASDAAEGEGDSGEDNGEAEGGVVKHRRTKAGRRKHTL